MSAPATPSGPPGGPGPAAKLALPRDSPGRLGKAVVVFFRQASPRLLLGALALATTALTRAQILTQHSTGMLAQSLLAGRNLLQLL